MGANKIDRRGLLAACPFCRSHRVQVIEYSARGSKARVSCIEPGCHGLGPFRADYDEAIEAWNADRPPLPAEA